MDHFQKFIYLLSLFLPVMVFFALGLWFAWAKWFKHCREFEQNMDEHYQLVEQLNQLYQNQTFLSEELDKSLSKTMATHNELATSNHKIASTESQIELLQNKLNNKTIELEEGTKKLSALENQNTELAQQLLIAKNESDYGNFGEIKIVEAILTDFTDDPVKNDLKFGVLFQEKPDVIDDLTELDGLSDNVASKLYEFGIYRFRQISLWTHEQFKHILLELQIDTSWTSDKNGLWQKQATKLHKKHHPKTKP